jgi:hypothetical protein
MFPMLNSRSTDIAACECFSNFDVSKAFDD